MDMIFVSIYTIKPDIFLFGIFEDMPEYWFTDIIGQKGIPVFGGPYKMEPDIDKGHRVRFDLYMLCKYNMFL